MFAIKDVIKLLIRIFVKQNKRFPKGLEGVDIRLKAKEIFDVGKSQGYKGGISENQLKQFLAFEKQAKPKEVIAKEGKILEFPSGGTDKVPATKQFTVPEVSGIDDALKSDFDKATGQFFSADEYITFIKSKKPIEAMKEANSVIGRKGRYKNITHEDADRILKDVDDHIFQRNIEYDEFGEPIKPDEFAQGGRIGYGAGDFVKKITKRFSKDRRKEDITKWLKEKDVDLTAEEWSSKPFKEKLKLWGWKFQPFYTGELEKGKDYAQGGIAPLVGEPTYAANFYDDRTPYAKGSKKAKKKKKRVGSIEDVWGGLSPEEKKKFWRMFPPWARLPHGEQRYKKKSDLPEGILELLEKDPGFDFENFKDT